MRKLGVKVEINPDSEGFPSNVVLTEGTKTVTVVYDKDAGFHIKGSKRDLTDRMINLLRLIYPPTQKIEFAIPQPLQVLSSPAQVLLFDDFEATLLKWDGNGQARDATVAYTGEASLGITCGAGIATATATRGFYVPPSRRVRIQFKFAIADATKLNRILVQIHFHSATLDRHRFTFYIYATGPPTDEIHYLNNASVETFLGRTDDLHGLNESSRYNWHNFVFEFYNNEFGFVEINDRRFGMQGLAAPASGEGQSNIQITADNVAGQEAILYIDDLLITEA